MDGTEDLQSFDGDMDDIAGHDMADLFGDSESSIPPEMPRHHFEETEKIDELSVIGCCQSVTHCGTRH